MMAAGGAVAIGGVVFAILNSPKRVLPDLEVTPTSNGMTARAGWRF